MRRLADTSAGRSANHLLRRAESLNLAGRNLSTLVLPCAGPALPWSCTALVLPWSRPALVLPDQTRPGGLDRVKWPNREQRPRGRANGDTRGRTEGLPRSGTDMV